MSTDPEKLAEGTLISHLLELRDRLLRAIVAIGIAFVPCMYYSNEIFSFVAQPLLAKLPQGGNLIATGVMTPFTTPFKLSFFAGVLIAMPYVIYQLWSFVAPGLYRNERRFAVPLLVSSILLFYVGIAFAFYFVFPVMFQFFASTTPKGVAMMTDINQYLDFVVTMFFCFGLAFEVPVAVVLLVVMGIVKVEALQEEPRLRADRHLHPGSPAHPAGCHLAVLAGDPDVRALRGRHPHGAGAGTQETRGRARPARGVRRAPRPCRRALGPGPVGSRCVAPRPRRGTDCDRPPRCRPRKGPTAP